MGKQSRRPTPHRAAGPEPDAAPVPVVGGREPCPCGSGRRYKACHGRAALAEAVRLVPRPFEGLPGECDWVALREIVPSATLGVRTTAEHGGAGVVVVTVLPMAWPALHRADGTVMAGLQTRGGSGDASRDVAYALLQALQAEPGSAVEEGPLPPPGPRLQDVLDLSVPPEITVYDGFDFWLDDSQELTAEVRDSLERANSAVVPTRRLASVEAAYWCQIGERRHLRWVLPYPENVLLDALARLHTAGESGLLEGSRYIGSFRAHGLVVPVWDVPPDTEAADLEGPATAFAGRLNAAMAVTTPLTARERGARSGLSSRQLTLR